METMYGQLFHWSGAVSRVSHSRLQQNGRGGAVERKCIEEACIDETNGMCKS